MFGHNVEEEKKSSPDSRVLTSPKLMNSFRHLGSFLPGPDLVNVLTASKASHALFKKVLNNKYCPQLLKSPALANPFRSMGFFLTASELKNVLTTSIDSNVLFNKALVGKLLEATKNGDYEKIDAILDQDPELLLTTHTFIDKAGRLHQNVTIFQFFVGACDYDIKNPQGNILVKGIVEMLLKHFYTWSEKTEKEIDAIIFSQYKMILPDGWENKELERMKQDFFLLQEIGKIFKATSEDVSMTILGNEIFMRRSMKNVVTEKTKAHRGMVLLILKADTEQKFDQAFNAFIEYLIQEEFITKEFNVDLLKALYKFRNHLEPKGPHTSGPHVNYQLLLGAMEFSILSGLNNDQCLFYRGLIEGYAQRFMTVRDMKLFKQQLKLIFSGQASRVFTGLRELGYGAVADSMGRIHVTTAVRDDEEYFRKFYEARLRIPKIELLMQQAKDTFRPQKICSVS